MWTTYKARTVQTRLAAVLQSLAVVSLRSIGIFVQKMIRRAASPYALNANVLHLVALLGSSYIGKTPLQDRA